MDLININYEGLLDSLRHKAPKNVSGLYDAITAYTGLPYVKSIQVLRVVCDLDNSFKDIIGHKIGGKAVIDMYNDAEIQMLIIYERYGKVEI